MNKHTTGPWVLLEKELAWWVLAPDGDTMQVICKQGNVMREVQKKEEDSANARLIAAAPELLAALERVSNSASANGAGDAWPETSKAALSQARVAIAKATGCAPGPKVAANLKGDPS